MKTYDEECFTDLEVMLGFIKEASKFLYKKDERPINLVDTNDIYLINMFIEGLQKTIDKGYKLTKNLI